MDTAYSKNIVMANSYFYEVKSRDSLTKEPDRLKAKLDNACKAKPNQDQNKKPLLDSDSFNNAISRSMETNYKER